MEEWKNGDFCIKTWSNVEALERYGEKKLLYCAGTRAQINSMFNKIYDLFVVFILSTYVKLFEKLLRVFDNEYIWDLKYRKRARFRFDR